MNWFGDDDVWVHIQLKAVVACKKTGTPYLVSAKPDVLINLGDIGFEGKTSTKYLGQNNETLRLTWSDAFSFEGDFLAMEALGTITVCTAGGTFVTVAVVGGTVETPLVSVPQGFGAACFVGTVGMIGAGIVGVLTEPFDDEWNLKLDIWEWDISCKCWNTWAGSVYIPEVKEYDYKSSLSDNDWFDLEKDEDWNVE